MIIFILVLIFLHKFLLNNLNYRISAIILLFSALLNLTVLITEIGIYNGLFHINLISKVLDFFAMSHFHCVLHKQEGEAIRLEIPSRIVIILNIPQLIYLITLKMNRWPSLNKIYQRSISKRVLDLVAFSFACLCEREVFNTTNNYKIMVNYNSKNACASSFSNHPFAAIWARGKDHSDSVINLHKHKYIGFILHRSFHSSSINNYPIKENNDTDTTREISDINSSVSDKISINQDVNLKEEQFKNLLNGVEELKVLLTQKKIEEQETANSEISSEAIERMRQRATEIGININNTDFLESYKEVRSLLNKNLNNPTNTVLHKQTIDFSSLFPNYYKELIDKNKEGTLSEEAMSSTSEAVKIFIKALEKCTSRHTKGEGVKV